MTMEQDTNPLPQANGKDEKKANRKKLLFLIGAVVVAVMFISSYAAFGNNSGPGATTTSIKQATLPVFGTANAIVTGYASSLTLIVRQGNATGIINQTLSNLEANNSINDYIQTPGMFVIYASKSTPYQLQQLFLSKLPANSIAINGTERVAIPKIITMYYYGRPISVYTNTTGFIISTAALKPLNSTITVNVEAIVLESGAVYQNNIQVSEA